MKFLATIKLKLPELELLSSLMNNPPAFPEDVSKDYINFINHKMLLMRHLRSEAVLKNKFPNTNLENNLVDWYGHRIIQRYSRQGDIISGDDTSSLFYPGTPKMPSVGFYFSSGQAAAHSIILALYKAYGATPNNSKKIVYFETSELFCSLKKNRGMRYNFFDSSSFDFDWQDIKKAPKDKILVFDTSCIDRKDPGLKSFLSLVRKNKTPAILFRSCIKLDSLGAEYGLLGSAVILNSDKFPPVKKLRLSNRPLLTEAFPEILRNTGAELGHFPTIDSIYPFLTNKVAQELSYQRVKRLKKNTKALFQYLQKTGHQVSRRPHDLFCVVEKEVTAEFSFRKYVEKMRAGIGIPFYFAETFGMDMVTVTAFQNYYSRKGLTTLRICPGDFAEEDFKELLPLIEQMVKKFGT